MTKKSIAIVFLLFSYSLFSQTIHLRIQIELESINCEDMNRRTITIEKFDNNQYQKLFATESDNCEIEYDLPKKTSFYRLIANANNYKEEIINFSTLEETEKLDLGRIFLKKSELTTLKEVTILGYKKQFIKVEADKTTYLVKDNPILSTGMVVDAVKKLPGVLVNPSGNLAMNGKETAVYIDGNPSNLSGQDLISFIQSLPANTVEKIELIANPGSAYEANTSGGIINIITYSKGLEGLSGTINLHYGYNGNNKPAPSTILNGKMKNINWQLQSGYNYQEGDSYTKTDKIFTSFNPEVKFLQNSSSENTNKNFYLRPMVNFKLSKNSNLILNYNLNIADNVANTLSESNTIAASPPVILSNNYTFLSKNNNQEFIAKFKTELDTLGKNHQITIYSSLFNRTNSSESIQEENSIKTYGINNIDLKLNNSYLKYDIHLPFKNLDFTLNIGGKINYLNSSSLGNYNLNNSSSSIIDNPTYINQLNFNYDEISFALYTEIKKKIGKLNVTAGLRLEDLKYKSHTVQNNNEIENHINNLFPTMHLLYELTSNINISANYTRKISLPSYNQLDPNNSGYFDQFNSNIGNPFLQPNFYDNFSFKVSAFSWLQLGNDYSYSKNVNLMSFYTPKESLNTVQSYRTYDAIKYYTTYASIPIPFGLINKGMSFFNQPLDLDKMSGLLLYVSYNNHKVINYSYLTDHKSFWQFYIQTQIILPYTFKLTMDYGFMTEGTYEVYQIKKPIQMLNINLTRKFFNKKLETSIHALDVLHKFEINGLIPSPNLNINYFNTYDSRVVWFKLTYNFGKLKNKGETEINSEKKQLESTDINNIGK
ncbi:outer membrane beta-barrel protein [Flavobacterium maritimum]|uniref:outer membrane beta-barrel protein n=1 Tax=Flavobacterium maritimum TaxID=3149042 RepID=UPI0032B32C36